MDWRTLLVFAGVIAAFFLWKRLALVSPDAARQWLKQGGKVIDVRTVQEYQQRHLPGAINIPLDQLRSEIARHAPNQQTPLLLHCLSGGRSGLGRSVLRGLGYTKAFNLGSYGRAEKILNG
jgi:phage shock protein E